MSPEDHAADIEAIAAQKEYGSTGDEECAIYRFTPTCLESRTTADRDLGEIN